MMLCTHTECGHSWVQIILPSDTTVDSCPVCEEEAEEIEKQNTLERIRENYYKARYYNQKYGTDY
jgi:hypothetical protein